MSIDDDALLAIVAVCLKRKSEEKKKITKRLWTKDYHREKRKEYTYKHLLDELKVCPKNDFRHLFIGDASIYDELLQMIGPLIKKKDTLMREAIPVGLRLSTTLRFLATGTHFQDLKLSSAMSPITISKIVLETCEAIIYRLKNYIQPPETHAGWISVESSFEDKFKFPNCLGVVGGKHIAIIKPTGTQSLYYNYKKFFSVVLLAVVNAEYEFLAADVDITGRITGDEDFSHTSFAKAACIKALDIQNNDLFPGSARDLPHVFVGNDGFQLTEKFLRPFSDHVLEKDNKIYNFRINRLHQIIENTFGALSSQFGVLQKPINLAPEKAKTIVLACCYLYNFLKRKTGHNLWEGIFDKNLEDGMQIKGSWRETAPLTSLQPPISTILPSDGEKIREKFVAFFNNGG